jgi:hypothetical protein
MLVLMPLSAWAQVAPANASAAQIADLRLLNFDMLDSLGE